jgi:hypothetical protein
MFLRVLSDAEKYEQNPPRHELRMPASRNLKVGQSRLHRFVINVAFLVQREIEHEHVSGEPLVLADSARDDQRVAVPHSGRKLAHDRLVPVDLLVIEDSVADLVFAEHSVVNLAPTHQHSEVFGPLVLQAMAALAKENVEDA